MSQSAMITNLQLGGGSSVISANSFCILAKMLNKFNGYKSGEYLTLVQSHVHYTTAVHRRTSVSCHLLAEVPKAFDIFGFGLASLLSGLLSANEEPRPRPVPLDPAPDDMALRQQNAHALLHVHFFD